MSVAVSVFHYLCLFVCQFICLHTCVRLCLCLCHPKTNSKQTLISPIKKPKNKKTWFSKANFKTDLDFPLKTTKQNTLTLQTQIQNKPWFPKARWRYPASSSFHSQLPLGRWSLGWVLFFLFTVKTVVIILKAEVWVEVCSCCIHCNLSKMETLPEYFVQVFCAQDVGQDGLVGED